MTQYVKEFDELVNKKYDFVKLIRGGDELVCDAYEERQFKLKQVPVIQEAIEKAKGNKDKLEAYNKAKADYDKELVAYREDKVEYDKAYAKYEEQMGNYQEYLKLKAQYDSDYQAYLDGERAYQSCLAETTTVDVVNPKISYRLSVTSQGDGISMMDGSVSGTSFTIKYSSVLAGVTIGNATLAGRLNMIYTALGGSRIRATLQSITLNKWENISTGVSYSVLSFPSLHLQNLNGATVWELSNYDPGKTRTVNINQTVSIGKSWDVDYGQTVSNTTVLKLLDQWETSQTGNVTIGFTNNSTITKKTILANTEAQCQLLRKPKPTEPVAPNIPNKPQAPTEPQKPAQPDVTPAVIVYHEPWLKCNMCLDGGAPNEVQYTSDKLSKIMADTNVVQSKDCKWVYYDEEFNPETVVSQIEEALAVQKQSSSSTKLMLPPIYTIYCKCCVNCNCNDFEADWDMCDRLHNEADAIKNMRAGVASTKFCDIPEMAWQILFRLHCMIGKIITAVCWLTSQLEKLWDNADCLQNRIKELESYYKVVHDDCDTKSTTEGAEAISGLPGVSVVSN